MQSVSFFKASSFKFTDPMQSDLINELFKELRLIIRLQNRSLDIAELLTDIVNEYIDFINDQPPSSYQKNDSISELSAVDPQFSRKMDGPPLDLYR